MIMNKNVLRFAGCLVLAVTVGGASAANRFVSADGKWSMPGMTGTTYTDLHTAVSGAAAGDTVWVKDGYVYEAIKGGTVGSSSYGYACIKPKNAAFTIRSESGYVDEAHGKGATIRGGYRENKHARPIYAQNKGTVIQGFVLEGGEATGTSASYSSGGAMYGPAIISNCVVRNCTANYNGGAFQNSNVMVYNTVISNCCANRASGGLGGAVYGGASLFNCSVIGNSATGEGGAIYFSPTATATFKPVYENCTFSGNRAPSAGCANIGTAGNLATFSQCKILGNYAESDSGVGGVNGKATLIGCVFSGNTSKNGAAAFAGTLVESCFSCLFAENHSDNGKIVEGNETSPLEFYNCTVAGNSSPNASCVNGVNFHNGIIWGNTFAGDELTACTAEYSCLKNLAGTGNISEDPRLSSDYRLQKGSPCVDTAKYYDWMRAAGDARSFDAAGYPRIRCASENALKPDMGCYERECPGSLVIGR